MTESEIKAYLKEASELSVENVKSGRGGPFGAVIVQEGKGVIARGTNLVTQTNDPTAHAEVVTIRKASSALQRFHLDDCYLFSSCEPCPMCLGAIYWAHFKKVYFAGTRQGAAAIGFDDAMIYDEIVIDPAKRSIPMIQMNDPVADEAFSLWKAGTGIRY